MSPDDHERRGECRDDFMRLDGDIENITKPGGTVATIYKKFEDFKACLQKEINTKVGLRIFMWVVGSVATLLIGFSVANVKYTHAVDKATAGLVTKQEMKEEVQDSTEYLKEEIDELEEKLMKQSKEDKKEILDAIRNK